MKIVLYAIGIFMVCVSLLSMEGIGNQTFASEQNMKKGSSIVFLHHSTGQNILKGDVGKIKYKLFKKGALEKWLEDYNKENGTAYTFNHQNFPKSKPYGWNNFPYDYYKIWVENAGNKPYKEEPTLEMLTQDYDTIVWKHCFPVSYIKEPEGTPDIASPIRTLDNYKLQYNALKEKMHQFPDTTFVVWTGATNVKKVIAEDAAKRMKEFVDWVVNEWDEPGDNIFLWDFYSLETEGGLYLKDEYAAGPEDSHPNVQFSSTVAPYFGQRIVSILEGKGDSTSLTGKEEVAK